MGRVRLYIKDRVLPYVIIPALIRREYSEECVRKNQISLKIACAIIFAVEAYNLYRVLIWSSAGLSTQNNRIYFTLYCLLIGLGLVWLVLQPVLRKASLRSRLAAQYIVTLLMLFWHMGLNTYDLIRSTDADLTVLTTALMGLALLIQSPPWWAISQNGLSYLLFRWQMAPLLGAGDRINLTITYLVSLTVSLVHAHYMGEAIIQRRQAMDMNIKLQSAVQKDLLTGLLNKLTVEQQVESLLQSTEETAVTLFLVDLDRFKNVNDLYGHPCGDQVLVDTAEAMRASFRDAAGLGRIGGDEFMVQYSRAMTEEEAMALSRMFSERLRTFSWQGKALDIRCSIGICICTRPHCTFRQLYAEADRMLYRAKKMGRGRYCVIQLG